MKTVTLERVAPAANHGLVAGMSFLSEDRGVGTFAQLTDGGIEVKPFQAIGDFSKPSLILRNGGIGDMLFLGFALKKIFAQHPQSRLALYSAEDYRWVYRRFFGLEVPHLQYPGPVGKITRIFPSIFDLEHAAEHPPVARQRSTHITSVFAEALGLTVTAAELETLPAVARIPVRPVLPPSRRKYIGVHAQASSWTRSLTGQKFTAVLQAILARGWTPVVFGKAPKVWTPALPPGTLVLADRVTKLPDQVEALNELTAFLGVDSCFVYFAQLFGLPTVGLYASVDPRTRRLRADFDRSLEGAGACARCYFHHRFGQAVPEGACQTTRVCSLLQGIPDPSIIAALESAMAARDAAAGTREACLRSA
jgi:hypothetical protein